MSNHQANIVHTTKKLLNGIYLLDKIKNYVKRFLERIIKVEQIDSNDIQVKEINRLFKVKSCSKETFHQLDLGDKCSFPTCTCHDWKKHLVLYKHSLAFLSIKQILPQSILLQIIMLSLLTYHFQKRNQEKTIYLLKTTENCN